MLTIDVFKTGARVTVELPPSLLELIDRTETGDLHFIISQTGKPFTVESFGNWFRDRCREAGVEKSAHGLRKLSATIAAEGGAGAVALMAQYGWTNIQEAERYTRSADYPRLLGQALPCRHGTDEHAGRVGRHAHRRHRLVLPVPRQSKV